MTAQKGDVRQHHLVQTATHEKVCTESFGHHFLSSRNAVDEADKWFYFVLKVTKKDNWVGGEEVTDIRIRETHLFEEVHLGA